MNVAYKLCMLASHSGGGSTHGTLTDSELFEPFQQLIDWSRTYVIHLGSHSFTFFDFWLYQILAGVIFAFACLVISRSE